MSQVSSKKPGLNSHSRFALAVLVNLIAPGVGNLLFVGRDPGTIICSMFCIWVWTGQHRFAIICWTVFMAAKAAVDLYLLPHLRKKKHANHKISESSGDHVHINSGAVHHDTALPAPQARHYNPQDDESAVAHYFEDMLPTGHVNHPGGHADHSAEQAEHHVQLTKLNQHHDPIELEQTHAKREAWSAAAHIHHIQNSHLAIESLLEAGEPPALPGSDTNESLLEAGEPPALPGSQSQLTPSTASAKQDANAVELGRADIMRAHDFAEPHAHNAKLVAPHGPFVGEIVEHAPVQAESSDNMDDAVIFDIYGEDNEDENSTGTSAQQPCQPHKKHVQLCPNCQRPREHNRPTCPACGTHFEEGMV